MKYYKEAPCKHCGASLEEKAPPPEQIEKKRARRKQAYYFLRWLKCPSCRRIYFNEEDKRMFDGGQPVSTQKKTKNKITCRRCLNQSFSYEGRRDVAEGDVHKWMVATCLQCGDSFEFAHEKKKDFGKRTDNGLGKYLDNQGYPSLGKLLQQEDSKPTEITGGLAKLHLFLLTGEEKYLKKNNNEK